MQIMPKNWIFRGSFIFVQFAASLYGFLRILLNPLIAQYDTSLKAGLCLAKIGAALINLNLAILTASMCRFLWGRLSVCKYFRWIPFRWLIPLHRTSAVCFLLGSFLHCSAHVFNLIILSNRGKLIVYHPTIITGIILTFVYLLVSIPAFCKKIKRLYHEIFAYTHVAVGWINLLVILHGLFCFLKLQNRKCAGSTTLFWMAFPQILYIIDSVLMLWNVIFKKCSLLKVIQHPSNVIEVRISKSLQYLPGQYVDLVIWNVSSLQRHPFTITSAPHDDYISIHMRIVGDWTRKVEQEVTINPPPNIKLSILGPFGCSSQEYQKYEALICIGAGVGQTPFASILKTLLFQINSPYKFTLSLRKLIYVGICRERRSFEWFNDILYSLEEATDQERILSIHLFLTGKISIKDEMSIVAHHDLNLSDPISGLKRTRTEFGRPRWDLLFSEWKLSLKSPKVGIFFCGPHSLDLLLKNYCKVYSSSDCRFEYHKEAF